MQSVSKPQPVEMTPELTASVQEMLHKQHVALLDKPLPVLGGKLGRNDPCPCGSGKKYKKRCGRS